MISHGTLQQKRLTISIKPQSLSVSLEFGKTAEVFSFDHAGRLWTALLNNISYRRGLDGKSVAKWVDPSGKHLRRWLSQTDAEQLAENGRLSILEIANGINNGTVQLETSLSQEALTALWNAANHDAKYRIEDSETYRRIYLPVGILPPDQYGAVVLQATEGCTFNRCSFCSFYRDRQFKIKSPDEFDDHCRQVKSFLGAGLSLRRTVFLGDANALVIPTAQLRQIFEITRRHFDVDALGGVFSFMDGVTGKLKTDEDYRELVSLGLKRVYIGLESGNEPLLKYLNKPSRPDSIVRTVHSLKESGASVGIIVLLGAGGKQYSIGHVRDTIKVLNQLRLGADDILYFSELVEREGIEYQQKAYDESLQLLTEDERLGQGETIEHGLRFSARAGIPHIARYDIREFVY